MDVPLRSPYVGDPRENFPVLTVDQICALVSPPGATTSTIGPQLE